MIVRPFDFVPNSHPLQETATVLRSAIRERFVAGPEATSVIHAELKVAGLDETVRAERAYWSHQLQDPAAPFGFRADTLVWSAKRPEPEWLSFPDDPYLLAAAPTLKDWQEAGVPIRVLRYVPLRRLTLHVHHPDHGPVIAKFKRRSRAAEAFALIGRVDHAFSQARMPILVSRPVALDAERALYFQSLLSGADASERLAPGFHDIIASMGSLHGRMHALPGDGFPVIGNERWLAQAKADFDLLQCFRPADAARLADVVLLLRSCVPVPVRTAFCHGDLVCSQFLVDGDDWSLTDFDLCHAGDPLRDVAIFLASLSYDLPVFRGSGAAALSGPAGERLSRAYLDGYRNAATVDAAALRWHRVCAGLYYLALMLKKDRVDEPAFAALLDATCRQAGALGPSDRART